MPQLTGGGGRFNVLLIPASVFLLVHSLLRLALLLASGAWRTGPVAVAELVLIGLVSDLYPLSMVLAVSGILLGAVPARIWRNAWHRRALMVLVGIAFALTLLEAVAEALFWAEFETRFNFLAVEYLIYRDEVARNILESYAVAEMATGLGLAALLLLWLLRGRLSRSLAKESSLRSRLLGSAGLLSAGLMAFFLNEPTARRDARAVELSRNGVYQFLSAFRANELGFEQFYITRPADQVLAALGAGLRPPGSATGIARIVTSTRPERRLNVVLISVESLSASFLGVYGSPARLTPALDALANESLWFSNVYATGTRTVRGLEALSLSIPPTPGHSIVKRPGGNGLRTIGEPFMERGYDVAFISGVYGYFDNMNGFFSSAGFRVVDRLSYAPPEVTFSNAWGIADENIFDRVLKEADADHAARRPFMLWTLTGSNHRPYTFPEGRIDLPRGSREAAVKYTDWAIGRFLDQARTRPWFPNTVFVIVADHCARSGGRTELPIRNFQIPLFVYAPGVIEPRRVGKLVSQIDLAPTLLNLLGFTYTSTFFGHDMLGDGPERAFLATYQALGLLRHDQLTVLLPHRQAVAYEIRNAISYETPVDPRELEETVLHYQGASEAFRRGWLKR